jgi:multidrug resistance efflux pump
LCFCYKQAEIDTLAELRLRLLRAEAGNHDGSHSRRGGDSPITAADAELARVDELWVQHRHGQAQELTVCGAQRLAEEEDIDGAFECLREAAAVLQSLTTVVRTPGTFTTLFVQT